MYFLTNPYFLLGCKKTASCKTTKPIHEPIVNNDYGDSYNTSNVPGIIAVDMPPTNRPIRLQDYRTPFLSEYSTMTDRPHSSSNPTAAYKPEDMPQPPPPSYQDYAKDVRVLHPPPQN
ncbi:unnamed protein product [Absidia cylindrospora]